MTLFTLTLGNIWAKKSRSGGIAFAVALAVMTVVTLTVVSGGLESAAAAVLTIGKADFTVAQKGVSDILYSSLDEREVAAVAATPGVRSATGALIETEAIGGNPLFIEVGIEPGDLPSLGVTIIEGRAFAPNAPAEAILGWRAARDMGLTVGDTFRANGTTNKVVGIYRTGISFGDLGAMFPLPAVQAYNRVPGAVTLVFVKVDPGHPVDKVRSALERDHPEMTTIRTDSEFGRADRNIVFLRAAVTGSTVLALLIGAIIVGNTMLLSLFERTREFGLLRAIGWSRGRIVVLVVGESLLLALVGSALGVLLSFVIARALESLPALHGVLHVDYTTEAFVRGLVVGMGMAVLGSLYPAIRAANLTPGRALSHE